MKTASFVYVVYIATTREKVWDAITVPAITAKYWRMVNLSDWKAGSKWEHRTQDAKGEVVMAGKVIESLRPERLVISWAAPEDAENAKKHSRVTYAIDAVKGIVRLTVTHEDLEPGSDMQKGIEEGWPVVLSGMKSLLETGKPLPDLW